MVRQSSIELLVDVEAKTHLDFSYKFLTPGLSGSGEYPLNGRPIAGN